MNTNQNHFDDLCTLRKTISHESFQYMMRHAYNNPEGWSFRINPLTMKNEMFVTGTRTLNDWGMNILDFGLHNSTNPLLNPSLNIWRECHQNKLAEIAKKLNVQVIYGHSRGGALVADMDLPKEIQKVGLSAAMLLARNKNMINLNEGGGINPLGFFDEVIGQTGRNNINMDFSPMVPHRVWKVNR